MTNPYSVLYIDVMQCVLAIKKLLTAKGLVSEAEFVEAFREIARHWYAQPGVEKLLVVDAIAGFLRDPGASPVPAPTERPPKG